MSQAYLILFPLHGTGVDVAIATSLQFLPLLLLGPFGGLIADRLDKRKVLYATQGTAGILALILGVLVVSHSVSLWEVYALAAGLGFVNLFDNPARQTFVSEMVGLDLLPNAVSLNSVLMNSARVIGPAIGGVLIITVGVATCFFINAASYAAVIVALAMMRASELYRRPGVVRAKGQVREGFRYVWEHARPEDAPPRHGGRRRLRVQLHGDAAPVGQVHLPRRRRPLQLVHGGHGRRGGRGRAGHGVPQPPVDADARLHRPRSSAPPSWPSRSHPPRPGPSSCCIPMGAASISFVATNNATLQLRAEPSMRGRVMSLNAIAFLGSTPIGAPLLGYLSDVTSPRVALAVGGVATLLAMIPLFLLAARQRRRGTEGLVTGARRLRRAW